MKNLLAIILFALLISCQHKALQDLIPIEKEDWWLWTAQWSPHSNHIVTGGTQDTLRLFAESDYKIPINYPYKGTITKCKWHPNKNKLAIATQGGTSTTAIFNFDTADRINLDSIHEFGARAIGWNYNGELLAVGDYDGWLIIYNEAGNIVNKIATGQKSIIGLNWHPSENRIVGVGESITLYDKDTDAITQIEDRPEDVLMLCVAWHPSGDLFVTGDYGDYDYHYPALLQYWTPEGQLITSIEESKAEYRNMSWSRDGEHLATASEKIRLWNKKGKLIKERKVDHLLWGIDWNIEGSKLVTTDEKGGIVIWDRDLKLINQLEY